jgi:hypothetical protein
VADGTRRWSYDTTTDEPEVADRNDLNGSPALGRTGIYVGGEHGRFWYVPYDYPLHAEERRCESGSDSELPADMAGLIFVTPGGNLGREEIPELSPATIITLRLVVRQGGESLDARVFNAPIGRPKGTLNVRAEPPFPFLVENSADGRYLHIIPDGFLEPGVEYVVQVEGAYYTGGLNLGNLRLGGRRGGRFQQRLTFRTRESALERLPLSCGVDETSAFEWTRLAVPIPPMLPSLNQIGFDYMDWIIGVVAITEPDLDRSGKIILWGIGGRRDENGFLVADPASDFTVPFTGIYQGDAFIVTNRSFQMEVTGIPIPFNLFQLRGQMGADLRVRPGATAYADTKVLSIPTFGPLVVLAGLANNWWQKLLAMATYVTRPYGRGGRANRRAAGVSVGSLIFDPPTRRENGMVVAQLEYAEGVSFPRDRHRGGILLVDAARTEVVTLDYHHNLSTAADEAGNLATISLSLPARTALPEMMDAVVLLDVFPLERHAILMASREER